MQISEHFRALSSSKVEKSDCLIKRYGNDRAVIIDKNETSNAIYIGIA